MGPLKESTPVHSRLSRMLLDHAGAHVVLDQPPDAIHVSHELRLRGMDFDIHTIVDRR